MDPLSHQKGKRSTSFISMKHPQDHQALTIVSILKDVVGSEDFQDQLTVLFATGGRARPQVSATAA